MNDASSHHEGDANISQKPEHVADVEMTNSAVVLNGQQQDENSQIANPVASRSTADSSSLPAQLDGAADSPSATTNGNTSTLFHPESTASTYSLQQQQQQQNPLQQFLPQSPQYPTQQQTFTQPAPLPGNAPRPPHSTPQPIASASSTIGTQQGVPPGAVIPPANAHGSPTRVYINSKVTPMLLEGMKRLALEEPEKPLKWLGEWLVKKSEEVEGD